MPNVEDPDPIVHSDQALILKAILEEFGGEHVTGESALTLYEIQGAIQAPSVIRKADKVYDLAKKYDFSDRLSELPGAETIAIALYKKLKKYNGITIKAEHQTLEIPRSELHDGLSGVGATFTSQLAAADAQHWTDVADADTDQIIGLADAFRIQDKAYGAADAKLERLLDTAAAARRKSKGSGLFVWGSTCRGPRKPPRSR